jgi:phosphosulfolactate phosphohydrolase-like enzyme
MLEIQTTSNGRCVITKFTSKAELLLPSGFKNMNTTVDKMHASMMEIAMKFQQF